MPLRPPKLGLKSVSTASTYYFRPEPETGTHAFGWALATVNDETGEVSVQSDWGKWSYQWNPRPHALGHPTLTHFIAERAGCDYLADKLWGGGYGGQRFSPLKTVAKFRRQLAQTRLEEGRHHLRLADWRGPRAGVSIDQMDAGAGSALAHKRRYYEHQCWTGSDGEPLTKGIAREIWDAFDDLSDLRSEELFIERLYRIRGIAWIGEELWNELESEQDPAYTILLESILPALQAACADRLAATPTVSAEERPTP